MTLSTYVYVRDAVDVEEIWQKCQDIIGTASPQWSESESDRYGDGTVWRSNEPGQGFSAWLLMHYKRDGGQVPAEVCVADCDQPCTYQHPPAWSLEVNFDTAYGYSDSMGGCGDLHARLVFALGQWLDERDVDWSWRNEFTGEVHHRYAGLDALGSGGRQAQEWFVGSVLPAIQAMEGR